MPITFHKQRYTFQIKKGEQVLAIGTHVERPRAKAPEWAVAVLVTMPPEQVGFFPTMEAARVAAVTALKAKGVRP